MDKTNKRPATANRDGGIIVKHGGYRNLKSFRIAQLVFDVTVRFCERYIDKKSRTRDQMVQAARSGVQNIAEGSVASGTSKKSEMKLTNVARASLEELRLDYEDFLRQRNYSPWPADDPRRTPLIERRCSTADDVAAWVKENAPARSAFAETAANAALVLTGVAIHLLGKQLAAQADAFVSEGGFTERLYRTRKDRRDGP
ncbi:four helix bundle suffix domain-containing protein [bacterium]|nr:four helix bundle suffix domain-containing protein [bacterium]